MSGLWLAASRLFFRVVVRAHPRRWRERDAEEMAAVFHAHCRDRLRREGVAALLGLWARTALGFARSAAGERALAASAGTPRRNTEDGRWEMGLDGMISDLRYALRTLGRQWGFALVAVAMLAVGIGGTTGIYSLASRLLLEPIPGIEEPRELVAIGLRTPRASFSTFPNPVVEAIERDVAAFEGVVAASRLSIDLVRDGPAERVAAEIVSGHYFDVLGVSMAAGRGFAREETAVVGGPLVTVLSHRTWVERFGADRSIVGAEVRLNGRPYTIVGVTDEAFAGLQVDGAAPELWVPLSTQPTSMPTEDWDPLTSMEDFWLSPVARLADGATVEQAGAEVEAFMDGMRAAYPDATEGLSIELSGRLAVPDPAERTELARTLTILFAVVVLVLVIVCTNLANLFLSRAVVRRREIGVRLALGAGRSRVVSQLLVESLVLSLGGGLAGLALSGPFARGVVRLSGESLSVPLGADWGIAAFALLLSVVTALLFGLLPALRTTAGGGRSALGEADGRVAPAGAGLRRLLAVVQVALSVVLLVGSALFVRSVRNIAGVDPGFDTRVALTVGFDLGLGLRDVAEDEARALYRGMGDALARLPGVESVAFALNAPFGGSGRGGGYLVEDVEPPPGETYFDASYNVVGPGYFSAMGIAVSRGREFTASDDGGAPAVAVVSEAFARRHWPDGAAVGGRISRSGAEGPWIDVVGVVDDLKWWSLEEQAEPMFYLSYLQRFESRGEIVVRARGADPSLFGLIREEVRRLDPDLPALRIRRLESLVSNSTARYRMAASFTSGFGALALLLAALGLYGLLSYAVTQRTREIGVRMALGARASSVTRMVTREGLALTTVGALVGVTVAAAAARSANTLLYGVERSDPLAYLTAVGVMVAVTAFASWLPARRASRVDPAVALRHD